MKINISFKKLITSIALGIVGGTIFNFLNFPLAWMMGPMIFVTVGALSGIPVEIPNKIRALFISILGVMLGSAFTPELLGQASQFGIAFIIQILYMFLAGLTAYIIFRTIGKYDRVTSYFSCTPGGLSEMTLSGEHYGGDTRIISINHSVRILIIVTIIPFYFKFFEGIQVTNESFSNIEVWKFLDILLLFSCVVIGYPLANKLKLPAAPLIGPMILSALIHSLGFTEANVPDILILISQLIVGTALGCRFTEKISVKEMIKIILIALVSAISMISVAVLLTYISINFIPINTTTLFLSIAPGGLAEMSLIALALGTGTAFVTVMHFFRVCIVMLFGAIIYKIILNKFNA